MGIKRPPPSGSRQRPLGLPRLLSPRPPPARPPPGGVTTPCTITETVTNNTGDTLDFSHTVANHLASNVRFVSATASTGSVAASGSTVVWNNFTLAPHQSAQTTIQVSFTPSAAQVGGAVVLSDGIAASAVDVTTGKSYALSYGTVVTNLTVAAASPRPSPQTPPAGGAAPAPAGGGSPAAPSNPAVSSSTTSQTQQETNGLPATGGAETQINPEYVIP